jgi:hypothetical protein
MLYDLIKEIEDDERLPDVYCKYYCKYLGKIQEVV